MSPMNLQCPSVAHPSTPLGELFERPLGKLPERSTRRAFRTIRPSNFPSRSLCFSRAPTSPNAAMRLANSKHISQWLHDACPHRPIDESSSATLTNRHQPRRRPFPIFQKTSRPFSMCLAKTQHTKGTAMNDFSSKLSGKRGSGPLNPLPLR